MPVIERPAFAFLEQPAAPDTYGIQGVTFRKAVAIRAGRAKKRKEKAPRFKFFSLKPD